MGCADTDMGLAPRFSYIDESLEMDKILLNLF